MAWYLQELVALLKGLHSIPNMCTERLTVPITPDPGDLRYCSGDSHTHSVCTDICT